MQYDDLVGWSHTTAQSSSESETSAGADVDEVPKAWLRLPKGLGLKNRLDAHGTAVIAHPAQITGCNTCASLAVPRFVVRMMVFERAFCCFALCEQQPQAAVSRLSDV